MIGRILNRCNKCGKKIPRGLTKCLACSLNLKSNKNAGRCRCLVCGTDTDQKLETCAVCGTNFLEGAEERSGIRDKASVEYICLICSNPVDERAKRCDVCGTVFFETSEEYTGPVVEKVAKGPFSPRASPG